MVGRPTRRPDRTTAVNSGRRRRRACAGNTSGGELLATLAPTAGDDRPARAGAHPQPEAVGLGPTTVVRLERALAHGVLPLHGIGGRVPAGRRARSEAPAEAAGAAPGTPGSWFRDEPTRYARRTCAAAGGLSRTSPSITEDRTVRGNRSDTDRPCWPTAPEDGPRHAVITPVRTPPDAPSNPG